MSDACDASNVVHAPKKHGSGDAKDLFSPRPSPRPVSQTSNERPAPTLVASLSSAEHQAVLAGVCAGDMALCRQRSCGVLMLFDARHRRTPVSARLAALRAYAELRRVMLSTGRDVPATSLVAAGFAATQIIDIDRIIAAVPAGSLPATGADPRPPEVD